MSDDSNTTPNAGRTQANNTADDAIRFLEHLRPNGPWILTTFAPDKSNSDKSVPTGTITARTAADVEAFVKKYNGNRNLYYTVNPTKKAMNKKPAKSDIAAVEYLLADLDPADGETSEGAKARYLGQVNGTFEPKPTAIIDSGNGIQCLWKLAQRIPLGEGSDSIVADVEARSAALMRRLGAKAGTQNIDRILRLPGTTNLPNKVKRDKGRKECPSRLLEFNEKSYPLELFVPGTPDDG